jgi:hypothetical protein
LKIGVGCFCTKIMRRERWFYIPLEAPVSIMTISFDSLILTLDVCVTEK